MYRYRFRHVAIKVDEELVLTGEEVIEKVEYDGRYSQFNIIYRELVKDDDAK